jgi:hypothetical protein
MQIQINLDNLQREEIMAIKRMVDALAREVVSVEVINSLDAADPVIAYPTTMAPLPQSTFMGQTDEQTAPTIGASGQPDGPKTDGATAMRPVESPAKRTRRTKAEMEAAKAESTPEISKAAQHPATSTAETLPPSAGQPNTPVSIDDLRSALQAYTSAKGMPAGIDLLKKFGCSRISELAAKDDGTKQNFMAEAAA